jgi:hypothetical protein
MRGREFLIILGGAVVPALAPLSLPAQQSPPAVIGILQAASALQWRLFMMHFSMPCDTSDIWRGSIFASSTVLPMAFLSGFLT